MPLVGNIMRMRRGPFGANRQIQNLRHLRYDSAADQTAGRVRREDRYSAIAQAQCKVSADCSLLYP